MIILNIGIGFGGIEAIQFNDPSDAIEYIDELKEFNTYWVVSNYSEEDEDKCFFEHMDDETTMQTKDYRMIKAFVKEGIEQGFKQFLIFENESWDEAFKLCIDFKRP